MLRLIRLFLALTAIPLIGIAVAIGRFWDGTTQGLPEAAAQSLACSSRVLASPLGNACGEATAFGLLGLVSTGILIVSFGVVPLSRLVAAVLGSNRTLLSVGFWPYALLITLLVGFVSLVHVGIFGATSYLSALHWFGIDSMLMVGFFAAVGLGAAYAIARGLGGFFVRPKTYIAARPISFYEYPRLGLIVRDIAKQLNARMPDNVVIGLEPTFFATTAPVFTPYAKQPMRGETLHLSLPLMSHFSDGELRAVIGHELGHFTGGDTAYSMKFAPVYVGLAQASEVLAAPGRPVTRFLSLPGKMLIDDLIYAFSVVERRIGRAREHRADQHGATVSSPEDIAYSLLKASLLGSMWNGQIQTMVDRGMKGRFSRNIVKNFAESVRLDLDRARVAPLLQFALGESIPHPIDTHPATEDRLAAFGLNLGEVCSEDAVLHRFFVARRVTDGLDNMTALEEDLTSLQYHIYSELWPKDDEGRSLDELFLALLTDFLALMVTIDGSVDDREILAAEAQASERFGNFDKETFRERCRNPGDIPSLDKMVAFANKLLTQTGIDNLTATLRQIAAADGTLHPNEQALLDMLEATLQPEEPAKA